MEIREELVTAFLDAARPLVEQGGCARTSISGTSCVPRPWCAGIGPSPARRRRSTTPWSWRRSKRRSRSSSRGRRAEGKATRAALGALFATLGERAQRLLAIAPAAQQRLADGLRQRLGALAEELDRDESRWLQELAVLAEKADIREELDRFSSHLRTLGDGLDSDQAAGRRLDFVCQELLRELNTTSAKCRDVELVEVALDARLLCEQIREQLLNVE
ncbi:MAG: DUF1732 domain-containing protein [Thermoanaerobaculia bacterium]